MDYLKLKELVERFWSGETDEQEEQMLRDYFAFNDYPEEFKETAAYFEYTVLEKNENGLNLDFDQRVLSELNPRSNNKGLLLKIAAGFALLFGMFFFMQSLDGPDNPNVIVEETIEDTYEDPQQAYDEVKRALMMVSGKMNTSKKYGKELKKFSHAKKEIRIKKEN